LKIYALWIAILFIALERRERKGERERGRDREKRKGEEECYRGVVWFVGEV
jgi:hypothetical protein